jgi:hypothetical protein
MGYVSSLFARCYGYLRPKTNWGICLYDPKFSYFYTNKILAEVENTLPCFELPLFPVCIERRAGFTASRIRNHESCGYVAPLFNGERVYCYILDFLYLELSGLCKPSARQSLPAPLAFQAIRKFTVLSRFDPAALYGD